MPTMKHILRKLHIGGNHDNLGGRHPDVGGRGLDGGVNSGDASTRPETSSSSSAIVTDQRVLSGISGWLNNARHTLRPSNSSARSRLDNSGGAGGLDVSRLGNEGEDGQISFQYYEEEYQVQLALALSVSNSDVRDDPESVQIRAAKRISLGRPPSPGNTPAEFIAHRYWNYNVLDYGEKVDDGFYDVYGVASDYGTMPSLVDLQGTPVTDNLGYEVVLVNRAIDPDLVQLEQAALCLALHCGTDESSLHQSGLIQKIADLVVEHMGGSVTDASDMLKSWRIRNYELRTSLNNIVLPLGCLRIGLSRHRALLFKVLADHVGIPCRLVKGSHYTGTDEGAVNIVKLDNEREYIIDLMGAPGTLLPAEIVGATPQMDQVESVYLVDAGNVPNRNEEVMPHSSNLGCKHGNMDGERGGRLSLRESSKEDLFANETDKICNGERLESELTVLGSLVTVPEQLQGGELGQIPCREEGFALGGNTEATPEQMMENPPQMVPDVLLENIYADSPVVVPGMAPQLRRAQLGDRNKLTGSEGVDDTLSFLIPCEDAALKHQFETFSNMAASLLSPDVLNDAQESASSELFKRVPASAAATATAAIMLSSMVAAAEAAKYDSVHDMPLHSPVASAATAAVLMVTSLAARGLPEGKEGVGECFAGEKGSTANSVNHEISWGDGRHTSNGAGHRHNDLGLNADEEMRPVEQNILKRSHEHVSKKGSPVLDDVAEWEIPWEEIVIGERIGLGSYGEVYHGDWHGTEVAVKKFLDQDLSGDALDEFVSEVRLMRRMQHPNVVLFMGAIIRPPNLSIVSEYLPRGSLFRLLHRPNTQLDEKRRLRMALDVARGMNYLHTSMPIIVHRDLKSSNLLVDKNWVVKVCDFGLSRMKNHTFLSSKSTAGTPEWMAPEVLRNEPSNEKCDVYSFGVILWELATLQQPWSGMNPMQVVGAVGFQSRRLEIPKDVDPPIFRIIQECWQSDSRKRPSFAQLMTALKPLQRLIVPHQTL